MRRALLLAGWVLIGAATQAAEDIEPLEADFLEYLANLEADEDNWTLLGEPDREPVSKEIENEQPAKKAAARKASNEAAKPAAEER
jgi:hypothetical protein